MMVVHDNDNDQDKKMMTAMMLPIVMTTMPLPTMMKVTSINLVKTDPSSL